MKQVLKGLTKTGYIKTDKLTESANDLVKVVDPEGLKESTEPPAIRFLGGR